MKKNRIEKLVIESSQQDQTDESLINSIHFIDSSMTIYICASVGKIRSANVR